MEWTEASAYPGRVGASETFDPLELYDELVMEGRAPDPTTFAARYPAFPDLLQRISSLEALRRELDRAAAHIADAEPEWPEEIGGFRLVDRLGKGGMGVVFAAERQGRRCALKMLRCDSALAHERFQREAAVVKTLGHPGIVRAIAYGIEAGRAWLATELVEGETLRTSLHERGALGVHRAVQVAVEVAEALGHAHERGVVHRDVKPENIVITAEGTPKLIDFGIALSVGIDRRLTRTGTFLGSPRYAAPEQIRGAKGSIGPWSDTYALGATLFEMLTGRTPYETSAEARTAAFEAKRPPRGPRDLDKAIPRGLNRVVRRALSPRIERRYQGGDALAEALRACR